ncbi:putative BTB/POZ domain-containing protein [Cotonvirus japonicus]|uniref:BTB/POZ domain-containing protein n=1 Tax=Cotonvirus japonicus TaxID=2811091 RepID=A0ABM7NTU3_9VIRU|nr:putative BTB/POZ domain-containing protein [Cotonvirus japonicus]BCS83595.1 putative BTB/POZ domain-containing protein [Cotonvirus japonicus]
MNKNINSPLNFDTLFSLSQDSKFSDLELTIRNDVNLTNLPDEQDIIVHVHKCILYSSSTYFKNLFTLCLESNLDKITIKVPNSLVVNDIIASFYGQTINSTDYPNWLYNLEYIKCCDYLDIKFDTKIVSNLVVPEKYFEYLMSIAELTNSDDNFTKCLVNNIPNGYDLLKLSGDLFDKLIKYDSLIISCNKNTINVHRVLNKSLISTYTMKGKSILNMSYSPIKKLLATANSNGTIKIFSIPSLELIKTLKIKKNTQYYFCKCVCFSHDGLKLASGFGGSNSVIKIWDTTTWKISKKIKINCPYITNIQFTSKNKIAVSCCDNYARGVVSLFNLNTNKETEKYGNSFDICGFLFNESKQLITIDENSIISIWYKNNKLPHKMINPKKYCEKINDISTFRYDDRYKLTDINSSPDKKYFVVSSNVGDIIVYDSRSPKNILIMNNADATSIVNAYFSGNYIITIDCNGKVKTWSGETGEMTNEFNSSLTKVRQMLHVQY